MIHRVLVESIDSPFQGAELTKTSLLSRTAFKALEGNQRYLQKLTYILGNLVCLAFALYKCHSMGILPTHPSDWLDFLEPMERTEYSGGGLMF